MPGETDFYGYTRNKAGQFLFSADYASVWFSNTSDASAASASTAQANLIQSAAVQYQHQVVPHYEVGSHELYWTTGQSGGIVNIGRIVGERGLLDGLRVQHGANNVRKGAMGAIQFKIGRKGIEGISVRQDILVMSGCVMADYGVSFGAAGMDIGESCSFRIAMLQRSMRT